MFIVNNVSIAGVVSSVPKQIIKNSDSELFSSKEEAYKFIEVTGVSEKRHVDSDTCTSDLCIQAAEVLLGKLNWSRDDVEILIMVTQTPDFPVPNTSIIVQDRLGLPKNTVCFDVPLGCSGYVYGLAVLAKFLQDGQMKRGLLLVGDTLSKQSSPFDKSTYPLFGDAGSATAVQFVQGTKMEFNLWTDGSGYADIIVPEGGYRTPFNADSLTIQYDSEGNGRSGVNTYMNGANVFSFGIGTVARELDKFINHFHINSESINYFYFHQANRFMNELIRKKLKLRVDQVPYSLNKFGNTSSATIPLTLCVNIDKVGGKEVVMCGFGVGLSIGIVRMTMQEDFQTELIEFG